MIKNPYFTVVIPLYNKEAFILKSVQSVLNQTFNEFELIIVNDGSTDASMAKIERLNDVRIIKINQRNQGRCSARNKGIDSARAEWICFLDADDEFLPDHLKTIHDFIQGFPKVKIICTKERIGEWVLPIGGRKYNSTPFKITFKDFLLTNPISINQCAFHRSSINKFPHERFPISEDWYYMRKASYENDIYGINEVTVHVNDHDLRTMHTASSIDIAHWNLYGAEKIIKDLPLQEFTKRKIMGFTHILCANFLLSSKGQRSMAIVHIKKSFKYFPHNLRMLLLKALVKLILR